MDKNVIFDFIRNCNFDAPVVLEIGTTADDDAQRIRENTSCANFHIFESDPVRIKSLYDRKTNEIANLHQYSSFIHVNFNLPG